MNAARDCTRGVEPRNHLTVTVEHLRLGVDADAAHRVVTGHDDAARIERSLFDLVDEHVRVAPEGIDLGVHRLVVFVDRLLEGVRGNAHLARELFDRVADEERTRLAGGFVFGPLRILLKFEADVVDHGEGFHLRLRKHGVTQHVAAGVLGHEALPFVVDEDEAVHLGRKRRIVLHVQRLFRNALDVVHAARFRADVDHVHEHFARGAGLLRRAELFETRVVNAAHLGVGGETARAGDDALRRTDVEFLAADA